MLLSKLSLELIDSLLSGFSHTDSAGLVSSQEEVGLDLYEFLQQFYTLFPEYQGGTHSLPLESLMLVRFVILKSYAGKICHTQNWSDG